MSVDEEAREEAEGGGAGGGGRWGGGRAMERGAFLIALLKTWKWELMNRASLSLCLPNCGARGHTYTVRLAGLSLRLAGREGREAWV